MNSHFLPLYNLIFKYKLNLCEIFFGIIRSLIIRSLFKYPSCRILWSQRHNLCPVSNSGVVWSCETHLIKGLGWQSVNHNLVTIIINMPFYLKEAIQGRHIKSLIYWVHTMWAKLLNIILAIVDIDVIIIPWKHHVSQI